MNWRDWTSQLSEWPGWRRHAPAGFSVVAHAAVLVGLASLMATATPTPPVDRPQLMLAVDLVAAEALPEPQAFAGVAPPPRAPAAPAPRREPSASSTTPRSGAVPAISAPAAADDGDSVYLPPSILMPEAPAGLRSLMAEDPCVARYGPKAKECAGRDLAARTGSMDSMMPRSDDQLAQHFGAFMEKCPYWSGCDGSHLLSTNGTRSVAKGAPGSGGDRDMPALMGAGASTLGGLNATTGRLGVNPDHRDRGFGD